MYRTVRRDSRDLQPDIDIEIKKKEQLDFMDLSERNEFSRMATASGP